MAKISLLLVLSCLARLQAEPVDPHEIVRRSIAAEIENSKRAKNYTFLQRTEDRTLDSAGRVKSARSQTFDVTMLQGSAYRRLIERDDRPLSPKEQKKEEDKLNKSIRDRRSESKAQRDERVSEYDNRPGRNRRMLSEIPDAFDFRLQREESIGSRPVYVIEGTPRAGYHPKSAEAHQILPHLKLTVWIDQAGLNWVRLHAEVIDPVSWALCLVRLEPGARFEIEQTRVNNEVWLPRIARITGSAKLAMIKKIHLEEEMTFKNFRRFQTDSQMVSSTEVR